jgi:hypothetical protein
MEIVVQRIRDWLNHIIGCFNCGLNGHGNIVVLQSYDPEVRMKNYRGSSLKNLVATKPYEVRVTKQKCACRTCGETFLRTLQEPVWPRL